MPEAAPAERRHLTVLFCDLVDSTALSERLDPEDLRDIIGGYRRVCNEVVQRFDGHIGSYVGDGLLIYFGYPRAHEDDARRAVQAGLAIVDAVREWNQTNEEMHVNLAVRVGIDTGLLVVGDVGSGDFLEHGAIIGSTPNLAARLQSLAAPNTVVLSPTTFGLVSGLFVVEELGLREVKGISRPLMVYGVLGESGVPSRFEASADRGLTPLVGRVEEIDLLAKRWRQAQEGEAEVVFVSGEPGIGKSRLIKGLESRLEGDEATQVLLYGSPYHRHTAFYPVITYLRRAARFEEKDTPSDKGEKLRAFMAGVGIQADELVTLFALLLSLPVDRSSALLAKTPDEIRRLTLNAQLTMFDQMTQHRTLLVVVEDAQWIDPSTLEMIGLMIGLLRRCRLLLLVTFRQEFTAPWLTGPNITALTLKRLTRKESAAMVSEVTKGKALPEEIVTQIVEKTDGVPLFIEELTKAVIESGLLRDEGTSYVLSGGRSPLAIPASLHDSLMARLDRLGPVKEVAQLAAALGRMFSGEVLAAVWPHAQNELQRGLDELIAAGLIDRRRVQPDVMYEFKHALVADAAYQSLLRGTRQHYHNRIAQVLEAQFPEVAKIHPELLAHHLTEAGLLERAVAYWTLAGRYASESSANLEAVAQIYRALELLGTLPENRERLTTELDLRIALNGPLIAARGYSAPELAENFNRALALCRALDERSQIFPVLYAQWVFHITTGRLVEGLRLAQEFLEIAESQGASDYRVIGHRLVGPASFITGNLNLARAHLEKAIQLYEPTRHQSLAVLYGQDIRAASQCYLALTLWQQGYPQQAEQCAADALRQARAASHAHTLGNALAHAGAFLHLLRGDDRLGKRYAQELVDYADEQKLPVWQAVGRFYLGWADSQRGRFESGIALMRDALGMLQRMNFVYWQPLVLGCLAEAHGKTNQVELGMELLREALQIVESGGERWLEGELHRHIGVLLLQGVPADLPGAEVSLQRAIDIARAQNAKLPELRAAVSLARLWHQQGRAAEAKELVSGVYRWFTEGHDVEDLLQARTLLAELG
jgi:class 3 adenylate cyclase/predicted ATPase